MSEDTDGMDEVLRWRLLKHLEVTLGVTGLPEDEVTGLPKDEAPKFHILLHGSKYPCLLLVH